VRKLRRGGNVPSVPGFPKSCLRRKNFAPNSDRPAAPRQLRDWAKELRLPMLLTVCIEAGRTTLTHTSWTRLGSRKWMSGQAAALAALNDRPPFANSTPSPSLRAPAPPSARRPPPPLDFYLPWMSPGFLVGQLPGWPLWIAMIPLAKKQHW